jgi:hypothetical protein
MEHGHETREKRYPQKERPSSKRRVFQAAASELDHVIWLGR